VKQPCPHCEPPGVSPLRLVLIRALFCAEETLLLALAHVRQQGGLLPRADEAEAPTVAGVRAQQAPLHACRRLGGADQ
jgi:hypothetical protein